MGALESKEPGAHSTALRIGIFSIDEEGDENWKWFDAASLIDMSSHVSRCPFATYPGQIDIFFNKTAYADPDALTVGADHLARYHKTVGAPMIDTPVEIELIYDHDRAIAVRDVQRFVAVDKDMLRRLLHFTGDVKFIHTSPGSLDCPPDSPE